MALSFSLLAYRPQAVSGVDTVEAVSYQFQPVPELVTHIASLLIVLAAQAISWLSAFQP